MLLVTAAEAAGLVAGGSRVGGAQAPFPIRPVVGSSRGLSPVHPVVGGAQGLATAAFGTSRRFDRPWRGRFASGYGGDGGFDGAYPGFSAGDQNDYGPRGEAAPDLSGPGFYPVIMAPPRPCVAPQIITIGRSARVDRHVNHVVRVVYGAPGCGRS